MLKMKQLLQDSKVTKLGDVVCYFFSFFFFLSPKHLTLTVTIKYPFFYISSHATLSKTITASHMIIAFCPEQPE